MRTRAPSSLLGGGCRPLLFTAVLVVVVACSGGTAPTASPAGPPDPSVVAARITEATLRERLDALLAVSTEADGFRAVGRPGYDAAADFVVAELTSAGWDVTEDAFTTATFADPGGSTMTIGDTTFGEGDIAPLIFAPAGDVTGPVVAIDWDGQAREPTGRGCLDGDYGTLPEGAIVLVRSGPCLRRDQVLAAQRAGAAAFVAGYPQVDRGLVLRPTLIEPRGLGIPAASASRPAADALAVAAGSGRAVRLRTEARTTQAPTRSIIADLVGSEPGSVVLLGAHLDSVIDGPGINDDGSGVAALLAIADALRGSRPRATIRLAFWSAEELGLHGSYHYATDLPAGQRDAIRAYLNADMLASPNGIAGVYDDPAAPVGSEAVRDLLVAAIARAGGSPVAWDPEGGSDERAFAEAGIPTGGVYSGALEPVADGAFTTGVEVGLPADPCYHQPCDDGSQVDLGLARVLTAALADVAVRLADAPSSSTP